jgi:dihydroxy-acid dehydratase
MPKNIGQRSQKARREWIQIDALSCGTGWDEKDLAKPQILIEDVFGASHPGSYHLNGLAEEASIGVFQEGGKPANFHGTDLCDGKQMSPDRVNAHLADRKEVWKRPDLQHTNGVLKRYARRAASAMKGAYLED